MNDANYKTSAVPPQLRAWLSRAVDAGASDLHLIVGHPPVLRLHGDLIEQFGAPGDGDEVRQSISPRPLPAPRSTWAPLDGDEARQLLGALCSPDALAR